MFELQFHVFLKLLCYLQIGAQIVLAVILSCDKISLYAVRCHQKYFNKLQNLLTAGNYIWEKYLFSLYNRGAFLYNYFSNQTFELLFCEIFVKQCQMSSFLYPSLKILSFLSFVTGFGIHKVEVGNSFYYWVI